ncbi:hypothetical protein TSUD_193000 [Trifolium subterraneum]|uniref:Integrase catalytic domain-containing protein n=1 Tax=Trifolium subterraneum TaxID=3900 RepID=A0A2Z6NZY4_TRISU|nr:hypothetical protein TSUD_193000 [Trifolium subterraneum]
MAEQLRLANERKLCDLKVKNYLFQAIDRSILETILTRETSKDIWDAMKRKYQGSSKVKHAQLQAFRREFEILAMGEGETVNEYFARTLAIANRMTAHGERMEQLVIVEKILRSMTPKFNYVVCSIEESNDVTLLSIDELQSSLIVHEQRIKNQRDHIEEQALKAASSGRGRGRSSQRGRGRGRSSQSKEFVECFKCHKLWHYKNECPEWEENAHYVELKEEEMLLMAHSDSSDNGKEEAWYLNSGCSNHMVGNKEWLFEFDETFKESVKLGNDSKMVVEGKGNVKLNIAASVMRPKCLQVTKHEESSLWHQRYAHLSMKGLKILSNKHLVKGLPELKNIEDKCIDCLSGKQHKKNIPKQANWRASQKLELVHSDICGPINPKSNGGNRYFITFTDDYSRKTWTYFLHEKSSAIDVFKRFKALVEKESGCLVQCLRTDRGGEFTSNTFNEFCSSQGIKRQLTTAYTPEQNGVSERKNKTLLNMVRSMISARGVPKKFWPEAVNWATYVMNRYPTFVVKDMTPEEAWSGSKPYVHHFRVFGCLAHTHVPEAHRKKLDGRSIKCVLLGVSEESKAYKLYDPAEKKIIVSRDVIFEETKGWDWDNKVVDKVNETCRTFEADTASDH